MGERADVWQGTLALDGPQTLQALGPCTATASRAASSRPAATFGGQLRHAVSGAAEAGARGYISSEWGTSDNNRKAKYYKLTRAGRKQLEKRSA